MAQSRKLEIEIFTDSRAAERAFGRMSRSSARLGGSLKTLGKVAAVGVGAAFAGLAATLKVGFDEMAESQKVIAQTGAVLKSTGGAAKVTASDVEELASSLSRMSGVDDELIQSGENVLLTFTKIRNEVGKGNDIFDQATEATLNLSVALGKDMQGSAILVGKALNDPIKGMSALSRAGIQFTEGQKKTITSLVESGNALEAQKLILKELETQFGGSAKAAGETFPGQLAKLRNSFEEMAGSIVQTLLPYLTRFADWANDHMPQIQAVIQTSLNAIIGTIETLVPVVQRMIDIFKLVWETANDVWSKISEKIGTATKETDANLRIQRRGLGDFQQQNKSVWESVQQQTDRLKQWYQGEFAPALRNVWRGLQMAWGVFGETITNVAKDFLNAIKALVRTFFGNLLSFFSAELALLRGDWGKAWSEIKEIPKRSLEAVVALIRASISTMLNVGKLVGAAIVNGIKAGVSEAWGGLTSWVGEKMHDLKNAIMNPWNMGSPSKVTIDIGKQIAEGLGVGFGQGMVTVTEKVAEKVQAAIDRMIQAVQERRGAFGAAFSELASSALAAFDKLTSEFETKTEAKIRKQDERRANQERARALREAQAQLGAAQAQAQLVGPHVMGQAKPEGFDQAQQDLVAAQRAVADAEIAIQRARDEKIAAQERKEYEAKRERQRFHLEQRLAALQQNFLQGELTTQQFTKRMNQILEKAEIPLKNSAAKLGLALAAGLREAMADARNAAKALAQAIIEQIGGISVSVRVHVSQSEQEGRKRLRQHGGPVTAGLGYVVGEKRPELFVPSTSGRIVPRVPAMAAAGAGGGGPINVVINAPNFYGSSQELATAVGEAIAAYRRRNGGLPF